MQRGLRSRAYDAGRLSVRREAGEHLFHRLLAHDLKHGMTRRARPLPVLGVGFGLAVTIGNAIGGGILRAPGEVAGHLPVAWLFMAVWAVGGAYAFLGSLQLSELATMIPRSGGQYVFSRYALGEYPGFIVGWSDWISTSGTTAAVALLIGEFSIALFPEWSGRATAIATIVVVVFAIGAVAGDTVGQRDPERDQPAEDAGVRRAGDRRTRDRRSGRLTGDRSDAASRHSSRRPRWSCHCNR